MEIRQLGYKVLVFLSMTPRRQAATLGLDLEYR